MEDNICVFGELEAEMRITDVTGHNRYFAEARNIFQPTPRIQRVVLTECGHLGALSYQDLNQVGADKTVRSGDEDSLAAKFHIESIGRTTSKSRSQLTVL